MATHHNIGDVKKDDNICTNKYLQVCVCKQYNVIILCLLGASFDVTSEFVSLKEKKLEFVAEVLIYSELPEINTGSKFSKHSSSVFH